MLLKVVSNSSPSQVVRSLMQHHQLLIYADFMAAAGLDTSQVYHFGEWCHSDGPSGYWVQQTVQITVHAVQYAQCMGRAMSRVR